jgi:hypothetical protein
MPTDFEKLTPAQRKFWDSKYEETSMTNYASEEKTTKAETPLENAMNRIDTVIRRLSETSIFTCTTLDRLIGERPKDASAMADKDRPAGEYYGLIDHIDRLEGAMTHLEGELDRMHGL